MSTPVYILGGRSTMRARPNFGRRIARLIGAAIFGSVITLGAGNIVQAGRIGPGGDWRSGADLRCGTGVVGASLPVVIADTAGFAWQYSDLYGAAVDTTWAYLARSPWRYTTIGPGESNQGKWLDHVTNQLLESESFSVKPGFYYAVIQHVYVDGAWGGLMPLHPGYVGMSPLPFCFA